MKINDELILFVSIGGKVFSRKIGFKNVVHFLNKMGWLLAKNFESKYNQKIIFKHRKE